MTWKIIADSSCDLHDGIDCAPATEFTIVPLTIRVGDQDFVDDKDLDLEALKQALRETKAATGSACPSPGDWAREFETADRVIAVTISGNLSGTYNSAVLAKEMTLEKYPDKQIEVIDSRATSGEMALLIYKINELIAAGKSFDEVVAETIAYHQSLRLLFTLSSFENLVKNGRMNKVVGLVVTKLHIRAIARASEQGTIETLYKTRGEDKTFEKLVSEIKATKDVSGLPVIITHNNNQTGAEKIKNLIHSAFNSCRVMIMPTRGLTSYYAEESGIIVSY